MRRSHKSVKRAQTMILLAVSATLASLTLPAEIACAENESAMDEGIREYTAGKYSDALGHLGGALNSEFNNAKLHYYMGSCYMKLRQKEAAVREFRIAYALEPTGKPGKYAKQALDSMDVDKAPAGGAGSSDVFTKGLQDQKALSKAIADYEKQREGVNIFNPATFGGPFPPGGQGPGYMPGGYPNGPPLGFPNGNPYLPPIPPGQQTTNPPNYYR